MLRSLVWPMLVSFCLEHWGLSGLVVWFRPYTLNPKLNPSSIRVYDSGNARNPQTLTGASDRAGGSSLN